MHAKGKTFWLYVVHDDIIRQTSITGREFENDWLSIKADGQLKLRGSNPNADGYSWDGCSPKWAFLDQVWGTPDGTINPDTEKRKTFHASMFHDILYQFGKQTGVKRKEADRLFLEIMKENDFLWSYFYYVAVWAFGWISYGRVES